MSFNLLLQELYLKNRRGLGSNSLVGHFIKVEGFQDDPNCFNWTLNQFKLPTRTSYLWRCFWLQENCSAPFSCKALVPACGPNGTWLTFPKTSGATARAQKLPDFQPCKRPPWMPINAEAVCVPPTSGISRCHGDINRAGCALSSALKLLLTVHCVLSMLFLGRADWFGIVALRRRREQIQTNSFSIS